MKIREVLTLPAIIVRHRELLGSFIWRDLRARYEGSLLGRLWPILNPLILFSLYYLVFALIMGQRLESRGIESGFTEGEEKGLYGLYIISGILPWLAFSEGLLRCTGVVLENGNLVKKIAFPSQLLPVYAVVVNVVYFLIGLAVYMIAVATFFGGIPGNAYLLLIVLPLQLVFTVGIGLFLGAINIFIRDTSQIVGLGLQLWFFTTPIVYPKSLLERKEIVDYAWLMKFNPMYHMMEIYRYALVPSYQEFNGPFDWSNVWIFALIAIAVFIPGHLFYLATKGRFADEL